MVTKLSPLALKLVSDWCRKPRTYEQEGSASHSVSKFETVILAKKKSTMIGVAVLVSVPPSTP